MAYVTKTRRGFFGWIVLLTFWGFQALMIWLMLFNITSVAEMSGEISDGTFRDGADQAISQAAVGIAGGLVAATGWLFWMLGTVILGILVLASKGKQVTVRVR